MQVRSIIRSQQPGARPTWRMVPVAVLLAVVPVLSLAAGVSVKMDFDSPATSPFPSNRFTVPDWTQNTFKRVNLPKPDCAVRVSDCQDIDVINTLDGFNTQPRITIPFTGDIDPATVSSDTLYLLNLGDTLSGRGLGDKVGINQVSWDAASKTLVVESDELLQEHSRYVLVVTDGIRDAAGDRIEGGRFSSLRQGPDRNEPPGRDWADYRRSLQDADRVIRPPRNRVVALSVFTTQSISADLRKIRDQIRRSTPAPVNFAIGNSGTARAVFPVAQVGSIEWSRQTGTASFTPVPVPTQALGVVPGAIGRIAFGTFRSPDYMNAQRVIPATGTLLGHPVPQTSNDLVVEMFLPSGPRPAGGWPVAIFGHGFTDSMYGAPWTVASVFASRGIATMGISVVGHGGGPLGTLKVTPLGGAPAVVVPSGGRGIDQDGNGTIDSTEGVGAVGALTIVSSRDGLRQTVVDLMQLVRQIQAGIDVEGDGSVDFDRNRIYYSGQSFGGIYGTIFLGMEGALRAGVPNVPGGSIPEVARLGGFRVLTGLALATRQPQLLNLPPSPTLPVPLNFNENIPLRDLAPQVNNVPGSAAIQQVLENNEWVQQTGNPVSYAPYIRKQPLAGNAAKPVIVQFAKGDNTVPNPTSTAIIRAGELADRTMYFRNDLAYAATGGAIPKNPHTFLTNIGSAASAPLAVAAQTQIALFFATDGAQVIDPDGASPLFEMPINPPLPETLNFLP